MKRISKGKYAYGDYLIWCVGYYPPDKRVVWEGVNQKTGEADYHGYTKKIIKAEIDIDNLTNTHKEKDK